MKNWASFVIETVVMGLAVVWCLLCGSKSFRALGAMRVDVIMKKISNKNTMSVMPDMLNWTDTLFLEVSAIMSLCWFVQEVQELCGVGLQFIDHLFHPCYQDVICKIGHDPDDQSGYRSDQSRIDPI